MRALLLLSLLGFVACLGVHAIAWAGSTIDPGPVLLVLFVGLMLVWIPAVRVQNKLRGEGGVWKSAPAWMQTFMKMLFVYGLALFIGNGVAYMRTGSSYRDSDGTYVVRRFRTTQPISEQTFRQMQNRELRFFSGWLLMFYFAAITMFTATASSSDRRE
jgi:hypothetical protein